MSIDIKPANKCQYDGLALGEIMLRLDPGEGRIRTARRFNAWEGGGEYNVTRGLKKCFGLRTAVATAFADNELGHLIEDFIHQGGVDTQFVQWKKYDGIGRDVRNGLNFTERGFGIRGAVGVPDRANTAASQMKPGDFDWDHIFGKLGVRWFHTGGIFAALSESAADLTIEAVKAANKHGTIVSYDLNYRPSLWSAIGGQKKAQEVNREIAQYVDVMIGNEEDFTACLGFEVEGLDENMSNIKIEAFEAMIKKAVETFPNFKATATTLRQVQTATVNDWGAIAWCDGKFYESNSCDKVLIDASRQNSAPEYSEFYEFAKMLPIDLSTAIHASRKIENQMHFLESIVINYRGRMKVCLSKEESIEWLKSPQAICALRGVA